MDSIVSERPFGVIFAGRLLGRDPTAGRRLRVRGTFDRLLGVPSVGDTWEIAGVAVETSGGLQVEATAGRRLLPSGRMIVRFVAEHVPGIGQMRADRLWQTFGANLAEVLADDGAVDDIAAALDPERPVLAHRLALMAVSAWRDAAGEAALVDWLAQQGVDDLKVVRRLHRILGEAAVERLAANPYSMVPLLSWGRLDPIGRRLLIEQGRDPRSDASRITGAADEIVKRMLRRGDTASSAERFAGEMVRLLGPAPASTVLLDIARRNGAVVEKGDLLRAPGAAAIEDGLVQVLKAFQVGGEGLPAPRSASGWSDFISQAEDASRPLSSDQRAAVAAILSRPLSCLAGGAGTGKTYACRVLCDLWARQGGDVVLCALAGKAALRLSRSTGRLARTLARTLAELAERDELEEEVGGDEDGGTPKQRARLQELCRLTSRTLLVIDEASMVDLPTVMAIARRMPLGGRILFVGDEAQLPPVGFGLVYHRLVEDDAIASRLHEIHRQAEVTGIPAAAAAVREGRVPDLRAYRGKADGIYFMDAAEAELAGAVDGLCDELGDEALVVTSTRDGPAGVGEVNERRHAAIHGLAPTTRGFFGLRFAVGDSVIYGRNDYRLGLFNGLFGRVVGVTPEERTVDVVFDGDADRKTLGGEELLFLDHAYAVTCHKCQGSSAPRIVVPIYPSRLLDRSWVYTAITRAERQVVLVGRRSVFAEAVARPPASEVRRSGMRWLV
ncbi:ATP-dependent RecD-like DNA helicase [Bradyrhizobium sp.]|uniref:ATP-dependent DNA helicase n=1 Tax=Bradyrhizobium sp. TaxID=376 RepID=UPI0027250C44|nr:AAA family ATPase [Bradyrhizobium sp.]MDO9294352.1 AAA family ATPase [Bradyrhizobium sp.]